MPETVGPEILVVLGGSIVLIALVIVANWLAGGWKAARIDNSAAAIARLALDYPDFEAGDALLSSDGSTALLSGITDQGIHRFGLIKAMGDTLVTRVFDADELTEVRLNADVTPPRLSLDLADFSLPHADIIGLDDAELRSWQDRITASRVASGGAS